MKQLKNYNFMKSIKLLSIVFVSLTLFAFSTETIKSINVEESIVKWTGYKVTGQHEGTISLKSGALIFEGNKLTGGKFVMDMTTINTTDIEGDYKAKLDGHLKSNDFFGVKKHKQALLNFTSIKQKEDKYIIKGDLTIKGITNEVTFVMGLFKDYAVAKLKIDRTKFDVKYGSASFFDGLKDRAIYDEFDLDVKLKF